MAIVRYLAMTAAEIRENTGLPPKIAWMACHFSPYCTGLSNLPRTLPPGSLLILDDITPIHGHDPERIARQLEESIGVLGCTGLLLDFQRPGCGETAALVKHLTEALPCPVAVSELYAAGLDCPVFLPPVPLTVSPAEYLTPWQGREVWLELALDGEVITLTEEGSTPAPLPPGEAFADGLTEKTLHCHYHIAVSDAEARFTLWRTREDLEDLMEEAERLGVALGVGLFQELRNTPKPSPGGCMGAPAPA